MAFSLVVVRDFQIVYSNYKGYLRKTQEKCFLKCSGKDDKISYGTKIISEPFNDIEERINYGSGLYRADCYRI